MADALRAASVSVRGALGVGEGAAGEGTGLVTGAAAATFTVVGVGRPLVAGRAGPAAIGVGRAGATGSASKVVTGIVAAAGRGTAAGGALESGATRTSTGAAIGGAPVDAH